MATRARRTRGIPGVVGTNLPESCPHRLQQGSRKTPGLHTSEGFSSTVGGCPVSVPVLAPGRWQENSTTAPTRQPQPGRGGSAMTAPTVQPRTVLRPLALSRLREAVGGRGVRCASYSTVMGRELAEGLASASSGASLALAASAHCPRAANEFPS